MTKFQETHDTLVKAFVDKGMLIEAGFAAYVLMVYGSHQNMSTIQLRETHKAFFAGAQHVFASIMSMLEEGQDPTTADLTRMDQIHSELENFAGEMAAEHMKTKGSG